MAWYHLAIEAIGFLSSAYEAVQVLSKITNPRAELLDVSTVEGMVESYDEEVSEKRNDNREKLEEFSINQYLWNMSR